MSKTKLVWLLAGGLMFGSAQSSFAMRFEHGKGDPAKPISNSAWPQGVKELANRENRIGGYAINGDDWFYYIGDAKVFNEFLAQYAKVQATSLKLVLVVGSGTTASHKGDWQLNAVGETDKPSATVYLPVGGHINLEDLKVPLNIKVEVELTEAVKKFVAEHEAQQKAEQPEAALRLAPDRR